MLQQRAATSKCQQSTRSAAHRRSSVSARAAAAREEVEKPPEAFVEGSSDSLRARWERTIRRGQDEVCAALEQVDGCSFREDTWLRDGGGGGITRVLQDGNVFEKAGVNVSVVYGTMPPDAYRAAVGEENVSKKEMSVPFFAAGISSVIHPHNPMAPTMHFNYRYFETDAPPDADGAPQAWWFGGGTDLTPSYLYEDDVRHFHQVYKDVCDRHDPDFYSRFKKWADDYFFIEHRGERRGVGGIFFDDLNDRDPEELYAFAQDGLDNVVPAYLPLLKKRMDEPYSDTHKQWQQVRRGRYVEFNLVYDRGTTFGLKTGGRIESILMSLPRNASWLYDFQPSEGTWEAQSLDAFRNPKDWLGLGV